MPKIVISTIGKNKTPRRMILKDVYNSFGIYEYVTL